MSHPTPGTTPPAYASPADAHVALDPAAFDPLVDRLAVRLDGGVVTIELADPDRRNMMGLEMTAAWERLMAAIAADQEVRAVLLTGRGTAFTSGGDTAWIGADSHRSVAELRHRMLSYYRTWLAIRALPMPTVAVINGPAIGAGAALALACDLRLAGSAARMSLPFVRMGLHPGMLSTFLLTEVSGVAAARDLLLTGRMVDAEEMRGLGIVSRVVPDAEQAVTLASDDLAEGLAALREKRPPQFTGR
ncbi:MAG: enoyl-CoA hydratase/isomerase family protein [Candidatus Nanopelagicales bacterium]|nr:enoyl-CoA hydratase/isomerase family protein [Candidatus Nanopelagicales bacterium]